MIEEIRELRKLLNTYSIPKYQVAKFIGCDPSLITKWFAEIRVPSKKNRFYIVEYINIILESKGEKKLDIIIDYTEEDKNLVYQVRELKRIFREYRINRKMFCKEFDITPGALSNWFKGIRVPEGKYLLKMEEYIKIFDFKEENNG